MSKYEKGGYLVLIIVIFIGIMGLIYLDGTIGKAASWVKTKSLKGPYKTSIRSSPAAPVYLMCSDSDGKNIDPYKSIKDHFNKIALSMCEDSKKIITESEDSLLTAVKIAIAGNIIDYGASNRGYRWSGQ